MDTDAAIAAEHRVRRDYAAIRPLRGTGQGITVLHIGPHASALAWGGAGEPDGTLVLALGDAAIASACFGGRLASALAMEHAIQFVEDAVFPAHRHLPAGSELFSADAGVRTLAATAGLQGTGAVRLDLESLERVFGRLAAVAQGSPAAREGIAAEPRFAALVVILREFLHHAGFSAIVATGVR